MRRLSYWLTVAFVFSVPWEQAVEVWGIGQVSKALGLAAGAVWIGSVIARGRLRQPEAFHMFFLFFVIWNGLTFYWSQDPQATAGGFLTYVQILVLLLMLWDLLTTQRAIDIALQAYVLGAFVTVGSIIDNYLRAPDAEYPIYQRFSALGFQLDQVALILAVAAPAAWYLAIGWGSERRPPVLRALNFAYVPLGLFAIILTGTRGAVLASIPTAILVVWSLSRLSGTRRLVAFGAVFAALVITVQLAPHGPLTRIAAAAGVADAGDEGALNGRWSVWVESGRVFLEHPVAGVGLDAHRAAVAPALRQERTYTSAEKEAHNVYLSVLTEAGLVGFMFFAGVIVSVIARLRRFVGWDARYWAAQLSVLAVGGLSLSIGDLKLVWIFLSLAIAASALQPQRVLLATRGAPISGQRHAPSVGWDFVSH